MECAIAFILFDSLAGIVVPESHIGIGILLDIYSELIRVESSIEYLKVERGEYAVFNVAMDVFVNVKRACTVRILVVVGLGPETDHGWRVCIELLQIQLQCGLVNQHRLRVVCDRADIESIR